MNKLWIYHHSNPQLQLSLILSKKLAIRYLQHYICRRTKPFKTNNMTNIFIKIWRKLFSKTTISSMESTPATQNEVQNIHKSDKLHQQLEDYLFKHYNFRFNVLTEQTEYAVKGSTHYQMVDLRTQNTFCMDAKAHGIPCWDKDISRLLVSKRIADYHPFRHYMDTLPAWDGEDRVKALAQRISENSLWTEGFHRWMLGMAAQWMGMNGQCANAMAPILISTEQGKCKSTFCSILLPEELQAFYIDKFDITSISHCEQKLSHFGLVNMDEFDRYSPKSMATLKNLMQLKRLNIRKSHRSYYSQLPRIASFIGTSNQKDLLIDTTGSRRYLCVEVTEKIDCTLPDHAQLYAQLKAELLAGERFWFTAEEEKMIQQNNQIFYKQLPEQEVFFKCYRLPLGDEEGIQLSATEIFCHLQKRFPAAFRGRTLNGMGRALVALGVERVRTRQGTAYRVVPV